MFKIFLILLLKLLLLNYFADGLLEDNYGSEGSEEFDRITRISHRPSSRSLVIQIGLAVQLEYVNLMKIYFAKGYEKEDIDQIKMVNKNFELI